MNMFPVHDLLQPYIYNCIHLPAANASDIHKAIESYPYGCPIIMFTFSTLDNVDIPAATQSGVGIFSLIGQYDKPISLPIAAPDVLLFNCKPHGAHFLFQLYMKVLKNSNVELSRILNISASWIQHLQSYSSAEMIFQDIENWLLASIPRITTSVFKTLEASIQYIQASQGKMPISELCHRLGMSSSSIEAHFQQKIGISPKKYARIVRCNHAYQYMLEHPSASWTDIAYQFQYADQVHLIREFKQFMGCAPSQVIDKKWTIPTSITSLCV